MNEKTKINLTLAILFIVLIVAVIMIVEDPTKKPNQYVYNGFVISKFRLESAPSVVFNDIEFTAGNKKYNIPLRNEPKNLEYIPVEGLDKVSWITSVDEAGNYDLSSNRVFITFNPDEMIGADVIIAGGQLIRVLGSGEGGVYGKEVAGAFTIVKENAASPKMDCEDATSSTAVIRLQLGEEDKVYSEKDCIIVQGSSYSGLIKSSEKLVLTLLGVTKS